MGKNILRTVIALVSLLVVSLIANVVFMCSGGTSDAEKQRLENLQIENAKMQGSIERLEKSIADYKDLLSQRQSGVTVDDEAEKMQREQIDDLLHQIKESSEQMGSSIVDDTAASVIQYAKHRLDDWQKYQDPIKDRDVETILKRLHSKDYHKVDAQLEAAKKAFKDKGNKDRVKNQHKAFKAALDILNQENK